MSPEEARETLMGETPSVYPEEENSRISEAEGGRAELHQGSHCSPRPEAQPLTLLPTTLCSSAGFLLASPRPGHRNGDQVHSARPSSPWTRLREASSSAFSPQLLLPALGLPRWGCSTLTRHPERAGGSAAPWAVAAGLWEKSVPPDRLGSQF